MSVFRENCHHGTNWRWGPLSARSLSLTAARENLADLGQAECTPTWGAQESPAQGPGIDDRAGSLPAPSQVSRASAEPLLPAAPLSCTWAACPQRINHAVLGQTWGPPPEMWLSPGDTPPQGLRGSCGLSLPPVAPSLVTPHPALSWHPGPSFIHSRGWGGGQPLCIPGPLGTRSTPLPRLMSHEALL